MPFKLKLKKSRHYSVVSKSLFVISVEILDGTNVECTLSSESTGQDCLDVVCQKMSLNQPKFFGLQYISCHSENSLCWLELDRPIKRQLDKYARALSVYLRVMYYVISGVRLVTDEVTRYHYFLQLKQDVIEGKVSCTPQQAIQLASYSMQAEFGNFDVERHTAHYLKDFQLFPKAFTDPVILETLTEAAIRQHFALLNLPQGTAEEYYICACQKLDGYGEEEFNVKDKAGNEVVVGIGLTGVSVAHADRGVRHFGWSDISNVINHKKEFTIESVGGGDNAEFVFSDVDSAKNAWRFCVLQHIFFRQFEMNNESATFDNVTATLPSFQQSTEDKPHQSDSYEDVTNPNHWEGLVPSNQNHSKRAQSTSCLDLNKPTDVDRLRSLLPSYRPAPDYETAVQQKYRNSSSALLSSELLNPRTILYSSQPEIHQTEAYTNRLTYPDVTHNIIEQSDLVNTSFSQSQILFKENRCVDFDNVGVVHLYKQPPPYPANKIGSNSTPDLPGIFQQANFSHTFINNLVSGSSPDLVSDANFYPKHYYQNQGPHSIHRSQSYLPPQHGTYENLATMVNNKVRNKSKSHIKTVSRNSYDNNTVNNKNDTSSAFRVGDSNITKNVEKVYDERGNIIYCMPAKIKQILQNNHLPVTGLSVTKIQDTLSLSSNSSEPIYENIPLPRQNKDKLGTNMHSDNSSTIGQVLNRPVIDEVQSRFQQINLSNSEVNNGEHLYFTIDNSEVSDTSKTEVNQNISVSKLHDSSSTINKSAYFDSSHTTVGKHIGVNKESSRTKSSTFTVNTEGFCENACAKKTSASEDSIVLSSGNISVSKAKKKRWGILMGKGKSSEEAKNGTFSGEKKIDSKNKSSSKQRWSTGLCKFNPLPPSVNKEIMCQLLENKLADSQLFFEFDKIPKKKQNADFTTALLPENAIFNRFKDVLPYEDNRLRLTPSKNNKYGYINASHITATVGTRQRFYIAAQGPTTAMLPYFWQCVWEAEVYLMVQLTDPSEDLTYLPDADERCIDINQDYQVWWEFSQRTGQCVTSKIRLCHVSSRRYRAIWHLHYTDWGDQGCPNSVSHFLGFLEEVQSVHQHSMEEIPPGHNKNPPILIHCTAGVGRTGLTILSDLLLYTLDHNQEVCIAGIVGLLRQQRALMVQTTAQYRFVYLLLIHYLKQTRLI